MSLLDSKGELSVAAKDLLARWNDVKDVWSDAQSREFEKNCLFLIEQDVRSAVAALDHMNHVLQMLESDCR
jgi:hypothetical protein